MKVARIACKLCAWTGLTLAIPGWLITGIAAYYIMETSIILAVITSAICTVFGIVVYMLAANKKIMLEEGSEMPA